MAIDLLETYNGQQGRDELFSRWPELLGASELTTALLMANDAGLYDTANKTLAARIAQSFRAATGFVQDLDRTNIGVGENIALSRLKRGFRDSHLILGWPYGKQAAEGAPGIFITPLAEEALEQILSYCPMRDFDGELYIGRYRETDNTASPTQNLHHMLADVATVVSGTRART